MKVWAIVGGMVQCAWRLPSDRKVCVYGNIPPAQEYPAGTWMEWSPNPAPSPDIYIEPLILVVVELPLPEGS